MTKHGNDATFELAFAPCARLVSVVSEFYAEVLEDADLTSRLALATHEMLENSSRYSIDEKTSLRIDVTTRAGTTVVTVTTKNRADAPNLAALRVTLDEVIAAPDPQAHYLVLMRRTAKRTDGSGLGLGRVRAESEMDLSYVIDGNLVVLRAETRWTT